MKRWIAVFLCVMMLVILGHLGFRYVRVGDGFKHERMEGVRPWTKGKPLVEKDGFTFAIVADRTGGMRAGVFEDAINKINLLRPEFVLSVGDLIEGYTEDESIIEQQRAEFDALVAGLAMPFFYVGGNHDFSNSVMIRTWKERYGRSYYWFVYKKTLFLCVNTEDRDANGRLSQEQIDYFKEALALNDKEKVTWVLAFMHQPIWEKSKDGKVNGWEEIAGFLKDRNYTVFSGHYHHYSQNIQEDRKHYILSTTGGGNRLKGEFFGEFDHLAWVTMTERGPVVGNLLLDGILAEDVVDEKQRKRAIALTESVMSVDTVKVSGTVVSGKYTTRMHFKNHSDLPVRIESKVSPHPYVHVQPETQVFNLLPFGSEEADLKVSVDRPMELETIGPVTVESTMFFMTHSSAKKEMTYKLSAALCFDTEHPCLRTKQPVVVDGHLKEWGKLPYGVGLTNERVKNNAHGTGLESGSFVFETAYDDDFLYVAVRVRDDEVLIDRSYQPWEQDSVMVLLDARVQEERGSELSTGTQFKTHLLFYLSPSEKGPMLWYRRDLMPKDCQAACVKTETGYDVEMAVPVSYLNEKQKKPWESFRLNVGMRDVDRMGGASISWRRDWYETKGDADTGVFIKN